MKRAISLVVLGAAIVLAACSDSTAPRTSAVGLFSVTLSGAETGQYDASGARPFPSRNQPSTFASALAGPLDPHIYMIVGYRGHANEDLQDMIMLNVPAASGPGEYPAAGTLAMGMRSSGLPVATYTITSGTVRITSLTRTRIAGEFSAEAAGGLFGAFPSFPADIVQLSAGTFDVPITR